jgi:prepilin-type N-terminal cleavage/methylation domain-containing protein
MNLKKGFTLIELLVVVAIIAILTGIVLTSAVASRNKGADAGVKANLRNAIAQAEVFYATNTMAINTYTNVCSSVQVGGIYGIGSYVLMAAKATGLSSYGTNTTGTLTTATCNDGVTDWAVEVPLRTSGQMWCVDSSGKSKQESTSIGAGTACF